MDCFQKYSELSQVHTIAADKEMGQNNLSSEVSKQYLQNDCEFTMEHR